MTLPSKSMVITSYIPAEKFSRAVEHPCQFWIGTSRFRLSVFGRRQKAVVFIQILDMPYALQLQFALCNPALQAAIAALIAIGTTSLTGSYVLF